MKKRWIKKVFSMVAGAMVGISSFGANLQSFAASAKPLSEVADDAALAAGTYSISTPEELAKLAKLVNGGHATAKDLSFVLTTSLDLTEGGEYTNGYCDKVIYVNGKVVGCREAKVDKEGKLTGWVEEPDPSAKDIASSDVTELEGDQTYVIKNQDGLTKFEELNGANVKGISVVLLGSVDKDNKFVGPQKDDDGKPVSWNEAVFNDECTFQNWKETGNGGGRYTPIGNSTNKFTAKFDGGGHEIKLTINVAKENGDAYAGVFGCVGEGGEICKLGVAKGSYISASASGGSNVGGIAGEAPDGTITGCYNTGKVNGSYAGGIAGQAYGTTITGCYNTGEVSGNGEGSYAGGIAGRASGTTISGCYNTGEVSATGEGSYVGGIAGQASGTTITGCYNTGDVSGSVNVGGIAGWASNGTTISGCYNTGDVSGNGEGSYVGGIVGSASGTTIAGCYNTGAVRATADGNANYVGGIMGYAWKATTTGCYYSSGRKGVGNIEDSQSKCERRGWRDISADELNAAITNKPEGVGVFVKVTRDDTPELCWEKALAEDAVEKLKEEVDKLKERGVDVSELQGKLDEIKPESTASREILRQVAKVRKLLATIQLAVAKADAVAKVDVIEDEVSRLGQLYCENTSEELRGLYEIKAKIDSAATVETVEQVEEQAEAEAQGVLEGFKERLLGKELNIGHVRSSSGGSAGFYKAPNGVITFRVVADPGYKISGIMSSGILPLKPGMVVKTVPKWVKVNFEKVL